MISLAPLLLVLLGANAQPDVFFISLDTIRADNLGSYGYAYPTSPKLDALAQESLVFDNAICEVPLTSPSFCSMLSSQFPRLTGTARNGLRMPKHVPLVQEQFQAAGYETICVQSNWTLKAKLSGLDRGFDIYDDTFKQKRWFILKSERDADDVTRIAKNLLENRDPDKPIFAWFHYSDPHAPYKLHRRHDVSRDFEHDEKRVRKITRRYDSEIHFADRHIGELLEALPTENVIVVFAGDHGESIYEHDYLGHGRHVYQPGLRIPLFIRAEGVEAGRSEIPARGIDIGPTLLSLAGLEIPETMLGRDLTGVATPSSRPRVIETYGGAVLNVPGVRSVMANKGPQRQAVLHENWKLILGEEEDFLFDIQRDPGELANVLDSHPERAETLRKMIEAWNAENLPYADAEEASLNQEDIEALETLGYID